MINHNRQLVARFLVLLFVLAALWLPNAANAQAAPAQAANITGRCVFTPSSNPGSFRYATDGNYGTRWVAARSSVSSICINMAAGSGISGIYVLWSTAPAWWELQALHGQESITVAEGSGRELAQFIAVPPAYASVGKFKLVIAPASGGDVGLAELSVFGPGSPPRYAPEWQPYGSRVDLLTIATHPDDEALYLSVPAVTYADLGMKCQTVFMTFGKTASVRRYEALESCWMLGNRSCPELGPFEDMKRTTKEEMMKVWPLDQVVGYLVGMIRKYKPSVIVTHDPNGEYGHGAHKLTEYAVVLAFRDAANPAKYPDSVQMYGIWKAGKLYAHLYRHNKLSPMSLTKVVGSFGNRTVMQVVKDAYARHRSQLPGRSLPVSGPYDMRAFGLVATNLAPDAHRTSMLENVSVSEMVRLNPWYGFRMVNRKGLWDALQRAKSLRESDYTPESWAAAGLPRQIETAEKVMRSPSFTQEIVDGVETTLRQAMSVLVAVREPRPLPEPRA